MSMKLFSVLLVCYLSRSQGKHLLRFMTFCQRDIVGDGQYDIEFDSDELLYVSLPNYTTVQRIPEFAEEWTPDPELAKDTYLSLSTCQYNIRVLSQKPVVPPEVIANPTSIVYSAQEVEPGVSNTLICFITDFHPPVVVINWTRNGRPVDLGDVSNTQYYSNRDFSFRIYSYLSFTPRESDVYSCSVHHIGLKMPLTRFWEVGDGETDQQVAEMALCVCGVILGLIGVVTGLWFIMKANKSCQA